MYADTADLLLDFWEQRRLRRDADGKAIVMQPSIAEWLDAEQDQVRGVLESEAFEAHACQPEIMGTADISEDRLVGQLMRLGGKSDPAELVCYLRERAGLLLPRGIGVYMIRASIRRIGISPRSPAWGSWRCLRGRSLWVATIPPIIGSA